MTLPSFLCIGAQKAGTTWLHAQLRSHPKVWLPPIKELHYFDHKFVKGQKKWTRSFIKSRTESQIEKQNKKLIINNKLVRYLSDLGGEDMFSEDWYRRAFSGSEGRLTGEITPAYCIIPEPGIAYVRSFLGPVKIIYLIRDPLGRMISGLKMRAARKARPPQTEAEWRNLASGKTTFNRGNYSSCIPRWKKYFSGDEILFLPFGRIAREPLDLLRDIEDFLGIDNNVYKRATERIHVSKNIEVPGFIVDFLRDEATEQREYLIGEFGEDFVRLI